MSGHTPGPWHRVMPMGGRHWTLGRIREHVASPLPVENEAADWALAEAAPELLEALKEFLRCNHDMHDSSTLEKMEKAVAKAEGKS